MENKFHKYLDDVLVNSKFKIDIFSQGVKIIQNKFPEVNHRRDAVVIVRDWLIDTDPYNRLEQTSLFNQGV